jgi:hypothetical protein
MTNVYRTSFLHSAYGCSYEVKGEGIGASAPTFVAVEGIGCNDPIYDSRRGNPTGFGSGCSAEAVAKSVMNFTANHDMVAQTVDAKIMDKAPELGGLVLLDNLAVEVDELIMTPREEAIREIETGFEAQLPVTK